MLLRTFPSCEVLEVELELRCSRFLGQNIDPSERIAMDLIPPGLSDTGEKQIYADHVVEDCLAKSVEACPLKRIDVAAIASARLSPAKCGTPDSVKTRTRIKTRVLIPI